MRTLDQILEQAQKGAEEERSRANVETLELQDREIQMALPALTRLLENIQLGALEIQKFKKYEYKPAGEVASGWDLGNLKSNYTQSSGIIEKNGGFLLTSVDGRIIKDGAVVGPSEFAKILLTRGENAKGEDSGIDKWIITFPHKAVSFFRDVFEKEKRSLENIAVSKIALSDEERRLVEERFNSVVRIESALTGIDVGWQHIESNRREAEMIAVRRSEYGRMGKTDGSLSFVTGGKGTDGGLTNGAEPRKLTR